VALASQGVLMGSLGAYSGLTRDLSRPHLAHLRTDGQQASAVEERLQGCSRGEKKFQGDGEESVGSNPAKNERDQIANRELSGVIAQHRKNLLNDLGLASHGL